jgi:hypothetical protein
MCLWNTGIYLWVYTVPKPWRVSSLGFGCLWRHIFIQASIFILNWN